MTSGLSIEMYIILPCSDSNIPENLKVPICKNNKYVAVLRTVLKNIYKGRFDRIRTNP